jgi:hypothetical protein
MNRQIVFRETRCTRSLNKVVEITPKFSGDTGHRREPDGSEEFYFSTEIDLEALNYLGQRAAQNKSGKATDGPLTVRIIRRRRL